MTKTAFDDLTLKKLQTILDDLPKMVKRMGKDGAQVEAFWQDAQDAIKKAKEEDKQLIYGALLLVLLTAKDCTRKFSFDPFKPLRFKCDDIARLLNFERYKKMRNL